MHEKSVAGVLQNQDAMKSFNRLNSLVELETNRLLQKDATERIAWANRLPLTLLFVISIEFDVKLK